VKVERWSQTSLVLVTPEEKKKRQKSARIEKAANWRPVNMVKRKKETDLRQHRVY
jgi:hypothetical protein